MNYKKISQSVITFAAGSALLFGVMISSASAASSGQSARLTNIITRSNNEITMRINSLNTASTKIQDMQNVSAATKTSLSNQIQTDISGLTTLKTKIDGDTDITTARNDEKTIFGSFRIYALVIPQVYDLSAVSRITTINGLMTTLASKLQTRITTAQTAGKNVAPLQSALSDLTAKNADALSQGNAAQTLVSSLAPDQGDASVAASNKTALQAAHNDIKAANTDFQTARQDAKTIIQGLEALH